jgi:hypothetical protein
MHSGIEVRNAAAVMAKLLTNEFGLPVTEEGVRAIIRKRWASLSVLAHAVHDEVSAR